MPEQTFTLPPQYDPLQVEAPLYARWVDRGVFTGHAASAREPYVIVIPPPNVTGVLHMGHGLNNTIQDVLIRFERMRGREALWLPGTDHAGIATQNVVERALAKEGRTRFDLGRDRFVERVWAFVRDTGSTILEQLKQIGASCDWTRTRFTLDPAYSRAVREVFVRLWERGLVYRGHRVIHWCPRCLTALSDEEAEFGDVGGTLYHIRYPLTEGDGSVTVATTRPETLLGDTAVVVHPDDPRGAGLVGRRVRLPLADVTIPILADERVDREFGTGFVKVTPAHDANDFEIGLQHALDMPLIMRPDGTMGDDGGDRKQDASSRVPAELVGMDRFDARRRIVELLRAQGRLVRTEPHPHAVRRCYRCDSIVEPRLSDQWFVRMQPLAAPALQAYRAGEIRIVPEHWGATYEHWMENIRDWNISRQLWWGHRIPVFTCVGCGHAWADRTDPARCPTCGGAVEQDPDVLDTWFSSWLWPFATFGWPDKTPDLARFYPGHTLVTAPEILFFWVARMIMAGFHFMDAKPFATVYLHGTARDTQHRRMSKSLGNGIDPLDVVRVYGADALRWTLIAGSSLGADVILDPEDLETTFAPGRNFANKLWNIGRFILAQLPAEVPDVDRIPAADFTLADRWVLSRLHATVRDTTRQFEQFRLDEGAKTCFEFTWGQLADWYVEAAKPRLQAGDASAVAAQAVLAHCCDAALRLLHPVVPFITEELWQRLPGRGADALLATADWPGADVGRADPDADALFATLQGAVTAVRTLRAEYRVAPRTRLPVTLVPRSDAARRAFGAEGETIARLAVADAVTVTDRVTGAGASAVLPDGSEVHVALAGTVDTAQECRRLAGELARLDTQLAGLTAKLANAQFTARAPASVVTRERDKERTWRDQREILAGKLKALGCG